MTIDNKDKSYLQAAISEAKESAQKNGGPFGAVLVFQDKIIARSHNSVTRDHDPTAHAEINVIREASAKLGTYDLTGAVLYSSCEPCPMCLAASYWARIDRIVYASTRKDAAQAGFLDEDIYQELAKKPEERTIEHVHQPVEGNGDPFLLWLNNDRKIPY